MPTLSLNGPFKKLISEETHQIKAQNIAEAYQWLWLNFPVLNSILFEPEVIELKSFVCVLHNNVQIENNDLERPVQADDIVELILPMSGG